MREERYRGVDFFQAGEGIRGLCRFRGLGDVDRIQNYYTKCAVQQEKQWCEECEKICMQALE